MKKLTYLFLTKKAIKRTHSKMIQRFNVSSVIARDDRVTFKTSDITEIKKHFDKIQLPIYLVPKKNMRLSEIIKQEPI